MTEIIIDLVRIIALVFCAIGLAAVVLWLIFPVEIDEDWDV